MTREKAINQLKDFIILYRGDHGWDVSTLDALDMAVKALEQTEPARKMGKWHVEGFNVWCTNCGFHPTVIEVFDYCPSCGAKMEVD